jgi:hypothetical protein
MVDNCSTVVPRFQVAWRLNGAPSRFMTMVAIGLISISVGACMRTAVEMDSLELAQLKESSRIGAVHYEAPWLKVHTFTGALFGQLMGPIGGTLHKSGSAHDLGGQIVRESGLDDPTLELKAQFITSVTTELGLTSIENIPKPVSPEDHLLLRQKFRDGVVFAFGSTKVELLYYPLTPTRYSLIYKGEGVLWNFKGNDDLWRSSCHVVNEDVSPRPTLEELTANQGQLLKRMVSDATRECASQLVAHFLSSGKASKSSAAP